MACATKIGHFTDGTMLKMEVRPSEVGLQERASNHLMLLRLKGVVVSDEEKAVLKLSGKFREDERKQTAEEASKWVEELSKRVDASNALINLSETCLRLRWQPVYKRHDLWTGFSMERGNLDRIAGIGLHLRNRGGVARSSEEAPVIGVERRSHVIQQEAGSQPV